MVFDKLSPEAAKLLANTRQYARRWDHDYLGTEHLALAMAVDKSCKDWMNQFEVNPRKIQPAIKKLIQKGTRTHTILLGTMPYTPRLKRILEVAQQYAYDRKEEKITPFHILQATMDCEEGVAYNVLVQLGLRKDYFYHKKPAQKKPKKKQQEKSLENRIKHIAFDTRHQAELRLEALIFSYGASTVIDGDKTYVKQSDKCYQENGKPMRELVYRLKK